jgi:hypothetical protein
MQIEVKIYDVGPDPQSVAMREFFRARLRELATTWKTSYGLTPGVSINDAIKLAEEAFLYEVTEFIRATVTAGNETLPRSPKLVLSLPTETPISHRYHQVVMVVCEKLARGFSRDTYPPGYRGTATEMRIVTKFDSAEFVTNVGLELSSCFVFPNILRIESDISAILQNMQIESGIMVHATSTPDEFNSKIHTMKATGAERWASDAYNAACAAAESELGWAPIEDQPDTYNL